MMRVITGSARGTRLQAPEGLSTRPTAERVKAALFSIIQGEIEGRRVLDLFAGSGQLGIEALSRGAKRAVFVDSGKEAVKVIRDNVKRCHLEDQSTILCTDYASYLSSCREHFDLVFLDPPYAEKSLENALKRIAAIDFVTDGGIIICERPADKALNVTLDGFTRSKDYRYGRSIICLYRKTGAEEA